MRPAWGSACLPIPSFLPSQCVRAVCTFSSSTTLPSWAAGDRHFLKCKVRVFFSAHQMLSGGTRALRKPKRLGGCVQSHSLRVPTPSIPPPTTSLRCDGFPTSPRPRAPAAPPALLTASDSTPCAPSKLSLGHLHIYFTLQWRGTESPWCLEGSANTAMKELPVLCVWKYLSCYTKKDIKLLFNLLAFLPSALGLCWEDGSIDPACCDPGAVSVRLSPELL